jgi:hypothetical protein
MRSYVKDSFKSAEESISWLLSLEDSPFTLNNRYLCDTKDKFLACYKTRRLHEMNPAFFDFLDGGDPGLPALIADLEKLPGLANLHPSDIAKLLPADKMEAAMDIMAEVQAYLLSKNHMLSRSID